MKFVLDTNVYIEAMRDDAARTALAEWQRQRAPHIHQHAVVAAELLAGASDEPTWRRWRRAWVEPAERVDRVLTPGYGTWLAASRILMRLIERRLVSRRGVAPGFFNDCLIAASAVEHGFAVVTHNLRDYRLIARALSGLKILAPLP